MTIRNWFLFVFQALNGRRCILHTKLFLLIFFSFLTNDAGIFLIFLRSHDRILQFMNKFVKA